MKTYKPVIKREEQVSGVFCNCCGKDMNIYPVENRDKYGYDFICGGTLKVSFGYGSAHDSDSDYEFQLCDECWDAITKHFVHKVKLEEDNFVGIL